MVDFDTVRFSHLGPHLGSRDRAHLERWLDALCRGRDAAPRCVALTRLGQPCRELRMRGSDRCHRRLRGPARTAIDKARKPRLMYAAFRGAGSEKDRQRAI
jgi:hypothetical protein